MNDRSHTIDIDHLVLDGLDVTPDRAEHIRTLVETELERAMTLRGAIDGLSGSTVRHLEAPAIRVAGPHADGLLAAAVASSIAQAVGGVKGK